MLEELEQPNEIHLRAIAGMYTQKCKLKKFCDVHIIKNEFEKGHLALDLHSQTSHFKTQKARNRTLHYP